LISIQNETHILISYFFKFSFNQCLGHTGGLFSSDLPTKILYTRSRNDGTLFTQLPTKGGLKYLWNQLVKKDYGFSKCLWQWCYITGIFFWTSSIALMFLKPQRFKGWFFPHPQAKPTLLGPVDWASLHR
jgi:hypothetical protein